MLIFELIKIKYENYFDNKCSLIIIDQLDNLLE